MPAFALRVPSDDELRLAKSKGMVLERHNIGFASMVAVESISRLFSNHHGIFVPIFRLTPNSLIKALSEPEGDVNQTNQRRHFYQWAHHSRKRDARL